MMQKKKTIEVIDKGVDIKTATICCPAPVFSIRV